KAIRVVDAPGRYIEFCKSTVSSDINLNGLKLVVDCANGAAYHIAPNVFRELGAEVIELGVEPNGLNINLNCGAMHPDVLQRIVIQEKADLGIALDGDGDRLIMVDHEGHLLDGDEILYAIVKHKKQSGVLKGGVVGTVMSNIGLEKALNQLDVNFVRVPVGDRYIMKELADRNWHLGGEPSGHVICADSITTGDGIITALQMLSVMRQKNETLAQLKLGLKKYPQVLVNVKVNNNEDLSLKSRIQETLSMVENELGKTGRVLLRRSGTESLIRVMVEGENEAHIKILANQLARVVQEELAN
ncbi:MAG: phosphoglucosamine mutase, partial [Gammaproteobacteria bacterium]|nr:phosphoglucosamine mutase [Gammaproteobacteria bacterium]